MKPFVKLSLGLLAVLVLLAPQIVFAAGTPAGTVISNYATMNFKDLAGNSFPAFNSNTVNVIVVQLAGVDISPTTATKTVGDSIYVYYPFQVTNTGNGKDVLGLTTTVQSQGWATVYYVDQNRNGVLDSNETTTVTNTDSLAADSSAWFIARFFVPYQTLSGTIDTLTVKTYSFYTNDTLRTATYITRITTSDVTVSKAVTPTNPKPGDQVTYTITYTNHGTSPALNAVISDVLNSNYTLVNSSFTSSPTADTAYYNSSLRKVIFGLNKIPALGTGTVSFKVSVNDSVPYHTIINNTAVIQYVDSTNGHTEKDSGSSPPVQVDQKVTYNVGPDTTMHQTQDVGLKVVWPMTFYNSGNGTDSLKLAQNSTLGLTYTYYVDANHDGVLDSTDYVFPLGFVTPPVGQFDTLWFLAVATIPTATADRSLDTATFTFKSMSDTTITDMVKGILTVRAPLMSLVKSVIVDSSTVPGQPVPGAFLTYTIAYADTGTGGTDNVIVTDSIPAHTTYVLESVILNGTAKSDATDGDEVIATPSMITVTLPHINAGGSGTIKFRVRIN